LETMIAAGIGVVCAGCGLYLGLWGSDSEDALYSRVLTPFGGALLLVGGLTWSVAENQGWVDVLRAEAARAWGVWLATGGAWRWGGLAALAAAFAAIRRLRTVAGAPADRKLNWNK
ncbi:MAG: hypothetical protein ACHQ49_08055, partial [Elusimicrobiota bacterium]